MEDADVGVAVPSLTDVGGCLFNGKLKMENYFEKTKIVIKKLDCHGLIALAMTAYLGF